MPTLSVAISPCPNDVVIFGAWLLGRVELPGYRATFAFEDVETLNEAALAGTYDVVKISAAVAARIADTYAVLPAGAAFGFGAGPKLVVKKGFRGRPATVAVPGAHTTAATLLRAALAADRQDLPTPDVPFVPVRYDRIVPELVAGHVAAGLLIHETALVAAEYGLEVRLDLGAWWQEQVPDVPVPLGVIAARRALGPDVLGALARALRQSLLATRADPALTTPLARLLAREKRSDVIEAHIRAYVGDLSLDMGEAGTKALGILAALSNRGQFPTSSLLPASDQSC